MSSINFSIKPPVIAHRGANRFAPENTLAAFLKAKELGVKWVEFDARLSACGEAVIFHDEMLDRTSNGKGRVVDYTYAELKKLDAGSWFNTLFSKEYIPTLKEVMLFLESHQMAANVEIKVEAGYEIATTQKVMTVLANFLEQKKMPILISSFSLLALREVRKYSQDCPLGFLLDEWNPHWQMICEELNCIALDVNHEILTQERIQEIKSTKRLVLSYTVNEPLLARELFDWGVDAVFSDCADEILLSLSS